MRFCVRFGSVLVLLFFSFLFWFLYFFLFVILCWQLKLILRFLLRCFFVDIRKYSRCEIIINCSWVYFWLPCMLVASQHFHNNLKWVLNCVQLVTNETREIPCRKVSFAEIRMYVSRRMKRMKEENIHVWIFRKRLKEAEFCVDSGCIWEVEMKKSSGNKLQSIMNYDSWDIHWYIYIMKEMCLLRFTVYFSSGIMNWLPYDSKGAAFWDIHKHTRNINSIWWKLSTILFTPSLTSCLHFPTLYRVYNCNNNPLI